jgi:zinc transport system substrate-binding protein
MRLSSLSSALVGAALLTVGAAGPVRAEPLKVVATIPPIHSLAAAVMEGKGEPRLLVKGASSEHTYSMRPSDARALSEAEIVVRVSESLEAFLNKPIATLSRKATIMTLAEAPGMKLLPPREGGAFETHRHGETAGHGGNDPGHDHDHARAAEAGQEHEDEYDPHLWLDTGNAAVVADQLAEAFAKARPEDAEAFRANAARLKEKLTVLDAELKAQLTGMNGARFIVFHDAYQSFEGRYGLTASGSLTVSPERQPGAGRLKAIRAKIAEAKSACVFAEPQFEPKLVASLVEDTAAKTGTLDGLGAGLHEGPELYFTMMRNLAGSLKGCLSS